MKAIVALVVALLAFPAAAAQDHGPWWDCIATYLSQRDIITANPQGTLVMDTMSACHDVSLRTPGEDLDVIRAVIAHFRRLNSMPDARPRTREDLRF